MKKIFNFAILTLALSCNITKIKPSEDFKQWSSVVIEALENFKSELLSGNSKNEPEFIRSCQKKLKDKIIAAKENFESEQTSENIFVKSFTFTIIESGHTNWMLDKLNSYTLETFFKINVLINFLKIEVEKAKPNTIFLRASEKGSLQSFFRTKDIDELDKEIKECLEDKISRRKIRTIVQPAYKKALEFFPDVENIFENDEVKEKLNETFYSDNHH